MTANCNWGCSCVKNFKGWSRNRVKFPKLWTKFRPPNCFHRFYCIGLWAKISPAKWFNCKWKTLLIFIQQWKANLKKLRFINKVFHQQFSHLGEILCLEINENDAKKLSGLNSVQISEKKGKKKNNFIFQNASHNFKLWKSLNDFLLIKLINDTWTFGP